MVTARRKRRCNGVESGVEGLQCFLGDGNGVVMVAVNPAFSFGTEAGVVVGLSREVIAALVGLAPIAASVNASIM